MFNTKKAEDLNNRNDYVPIEKFIKNSKELFQQLAPIYNNNKQPDKKQNIIFKYLSRIQFGIFILPYLSLNEVLYVRATCKEINILITSKICCLNYYFKTLKKYISFNDQSNLSHNKNKLSSQLKPFHELNDESEFLEQKNILNKIKNYIKSPEFSLEHLIHIYRVEMDYLKYEENHQERYMNSLIETRKKINEEYEVIIGKNKKREESWVNISMEKNKINEDSLKELSDEELKKKIEELKMKKEKILFKLNKAKKTNEELMAKNDENKKIINKIKNINNNKKIDEGNDNDNENENDNINIVKEFLKINN